MRRARHFRPISVSPPLLAMCDPTRGRLRGVMDPNSAAMYPRVPDPWCAREARFSLHCGLMTGFLVVLIPLLLLFFLFAMQRIEYSLLSSPGVDSSSETTSPDGGLPTESGEDSSGDEGSPSQPKAA